MATVRGVQWYCRVDPVLFELISKVKPEKRRGWSVLIKNMMGLKEMLQNMGVRYRVKAIS